MNGHRRHRRVKRPITEGQVLGHGVDGRSQMGGPLRPHRGGRLHGRDLEVRRFVGSGAGADVQNGARAAQRGTNQGRDARIAPASLRVAATPLFVIDVARGGHAWSPKERNRAADNGTSSNYSGIIVERQKG